MQGFSTLPLLEPHFHVIMETLIGEILRLPVVDTHAMMCTAIIIDLCKRHPSLPPYVAESIDCVFRRIDTMDIECIDRFTNWLAVHLSNFKFRWNWSSWTDIILQPEVKICTYPTRFHFAYVLSLSLPPDLSTISIYCTSETLFFLNRTTSSNTFL